jgi:hypothetical protein
MDKNTQEFYDRLKVELDLSKHGQLRTYSNLSCLAKMIILCSIGFDCMGAVIKTTKSKTGKFTSISIDVTMKDAQEIVDK